MSGDATTVCYGLPSANCRLCDGALGIGDQQVVQTYHDDAEPTLDATVFGLCLDCRVDVAELVDTWTTVPEPPVDVATIPAGYDRIGDDCSFCEKPLADTPVVGLEYYRAGVDHDDGLDELRHYVLCPHCVGVFSEFLNEITTD